MAMLQIKQEVKQEIKQEDELEEEMGEQQVSVLLNHSVKPRSSTLCAHLLQPQVKFQRMMKILALARKVKLMVLAIQSQVMMEVKLLLLKPQLLAVLAHLRPFQKQEVRHRYIATQDLASVPHRKLMVVQIFGRLELRLLFHIQACWHNIVRTEALLPRNWASRGVSMRECWV